MQSGHIRVNGRWWLLKVREWVVKEGAKKRVDSYKKLRLVRHNEDGGHVPSDVQALADLELAKVNVGQGQGQSADSIRAYIEKHLDSGKGRDGRRLEDSTLRSYRKDYNTIKHLIPDMQMRQVRTPDINRIFEALIEQDEQDQDGDDNGYRATSSYRNIRNFLSGVFRAAVGKGAIDFNPVRDAMVLRGNDSDTHAYSLEEIRDICAVSDHTAKALFMVLAFTGIRRGEARSIRWEDYNRDEGLLYIQRAVDERGKIKDPKTKASKAPVPVGGIVKKALDEHLKKNSGTGFIFHAENEPETLINFAHLVSDNIRPRLEKAGLVWHGFHAARRGVDTAMKDLGVDKSIRVDIMRHVPRDVTDKHYGKPSLNQMRIALEKVEAAYNQIAKKGRR